MLKILYLSLRLVANGHVRCDKNISRNLYKNCLACSGDFRDETLAGSSKGIKGS